MNENCHVDLILQKPTHSIFEVIKTILVPEFVQGCEFEENDELEEDVSKLDDQFTNADLIFRQPVDSSIELVHTILENTPMEFQDHRGLEIGSDENSVSSKICEEREELEIENKEVLEEKCEGSGKAVLDVPESSANEISEEGCDGNEERRECEAEKEEKMEEKMIGEPEEENTLVIGEDHGIAEGSDEIIEEDGCSKSGEEESQSEKVEIASRPESKVKISPSEMIEENIGDIPEMGSESISDTGTQILKELEEEKKIPMEDQKDSNQSDGEKNEVLERIGEDQDGIEREPREEEVQNLEDETMGIEGSVENEEMVTSDEAGIDVKGETGPETKIEGSAESGMVLERMKDETDFEDKKSAKEDPSDLSRSDIIVQFVDDAPQSQDQPIHDEIKEWRDADVISLKSLKSLVAEVGCSTNTQPVTDTLLTDRIVEQLDAEETIKILKVVPSETDLIELDLTSDPKIIQIPIPPVVVTEIRQPVDDEDVALKNKEESEERDSIGELSEHTIQRFNTSFDEQARRDSFSSISSFGDRQKFRTAVENIRQDLLPFQSSVSQFLDSTPDRQIVVNASMDSPSDLSPNASRNPIGSEHAASEKDHPSTDGSIDSSGFEKVDHESLEEFSNPVSDPMQQSVFGSLQNISLLQYASENGFCLIEKQIRKSPTIVNKMSHDDVIEKDYFGASDAAKILDSPISEEVKNLVDEAVESASHFQAPKSDEIVVEKISEAKDSIAELIGEGLTRSPEVPNIPDAINSEDLLDIGDVVENVHNEIDEYLQDAHQRDPTPPVEEEFQESEVPHFGRQTPEDEEERTFDRNGPLTIPEEVAAEEIDTRFESVPRPPTPPKDLSDEDVKPSMVNLGPPPAHSSSSHHHSILKHHAEPWFDLKSVDPAVLDLIYWRDPKKSAISMSLALLALFVIGRYPLLSVLSYSGLAVLATTLGFRIFKSAEAQIKKTGGENPFEEILAQELSLPQEKVHAQVDVLVEHGTCLANRAKKLLFVENILDSMQFGLLLWALTYIASWFSGFTLALLSIVGLFSIPKLYETYQEPIDAHIDLIKGHIQNVQNLLEEKIPFLRRAAATEEKKDQ